jgi:hypothetical protein
MPSNPVYIIHETQEYGKFKIDPTNRRTDDNYVEQMKRDIKQHNFLFEFPLVVDSDMNLLDGQNRLRAARELGVPVYYIISNNMKMKHVPLVNGRRRSWRLEDYLHHYFERGYPDYVALDRFVQSFPNVRLSDAITLCHKHDEDEVYYGDVERGREKVRKLFTDGDYTCNNLPFAEKVAAAARDFRAYLPQYYTHRTFVRAIANLVANPQYDHGRMMQKMSYQSAKLKPCVKTSDYMPMLTEIYNYNQKRDWVELKTNGKHQKK